MDTPNAVLHDSVIYLFAGVALISLVLLAALLPLSLLFTIWVTRWYARKLRAPKNSVGRTLVGWLLMTMFNVAVGVLGNRFADQHGLPLWARQSVLTCAQVGVIYLMLSWMFALRPLRTLALVGITLVLGMIGFGTVLGAVRPFVVEAFVIPTESMAPTIQKDDRITAIKFISPRRLDLVVYRVTLNGQSTNYCKRIVGMPGDRVRFENGNLYINDQATVYSPLAAGQYRIPRGARYREGQTIQLSSDECFMLGDNVDRSFDSRFLGPAKRADIVGVVDLRYWPFDRLLVLR